MRRLLSLGRVKEGDVEGASIGLARLLEHAALEVFVLFARIGPLSIDARDVLVSGEHEVRIVLEERP